MNLEFTGNAEGPVTYLGKYQVETGSILNDVGENDVNALLQTGAFRVLEDNWPPIKEDKKEPPKKSSDSKDTKKEKE